MSRITDAFSHGKAFIPFLTCGDPDLETTEAAVRAMAAAGADLIELGVPFSDPTAEGPVIQAANQRALASGTTTDKIFEMVRRLRRDVTTPMVFMTYANVVFSYGTERFISTAAEAGMARLEAVLCEEDSAYDSRDKRERLVSAYAGWLEAETRYVSYLLAELLSQMAPEQQEQALEAMTYMEAFEGFYDGAGSVSPERLPAGAEQALEALKESRRQLSAQGLSLPGEWE